MIRSEFNRGCSIDAQRILEDLSTRQHLVPHATIETALTASYEALGFSPEAGHKAIVWMGLDQAKAIGRFRRSELAQLAKRIVSFEAAARADWQQVRLA